ncbi:hypothetical protein B7494_g6570 [Chlorociboria aeruginascens]|nr:hypothetical protein B7494_g6570 [Chlorociboria aeruginascens]
MQFQVFASSAEKQSLVDIEAKIMPNPPSRCLVWDKLPQITINKANESDTTLDDEDWDVGEDELDEDPIQTDTIPIKPSKYLGAPTTNPSKSLKIIDDNIPKSHKPGFVPPLPIMEEGIARQTLLRKLLQQNHSNTNEDRSLSRNSPQSTLDNFQEFDLIDFSIYLPENRYHSFEFRGLEDLANKVAHSRFLFDGILKVGNACHYVQGISFKICSIGNYGSDIDSVDDNIWIQSDMNTKSDVYYRLRNPSPEYLRFYDGFRWLANLAKHFVDYCQDSREAQISVSIHNFQSDFSEWAQKTHSTSSKFRQWYQDYQHTDFRNTVVVNIDFLFKEAMGVNEDLVSEPIWREVKDKTAIPKQLAKETRTVVTPYIYNLFSHLRFGQNLKEMEPLNAAKAQREIQGQNLRMTMGKSAARSVVEIPLRVAKPGVESSLSKQKPMTEEESAKFLAAHKQKMKNIEVGDVLAVTKDTKDSSVWKDEVSRWKEADKCWYIYVQAIDTKANEERSFGGLWLYRPSDTSCAKMKYPFPNELFLSSNCSCKQNTISEDEVLDVVTVAWHGDPSVSLDSFFIRQTYVDNEKFVTLKDSHKTCKHRSQAKHISAGKFQLGQTVLAPSPRRKSKYGLEPYEFVKYTHEDSKHLAVLRRLLRRCEINGQQSRPPNELVYTDKTDTVPASKVERSCLVRFYSEEDVENNSIPPPYNRDGTGNAFYITTKLLEENGVHELKPIEESVPHTLIQGFDPLAPPPRKALRGMDLYCGGGNFGRGLEEGGALENNWAVDLSANAIHTYYVNLKDPAKTKLFHGSVDDLLNEAIQGNPRSSDLIPCPGEVDFISAGSPCQGFSYLNPIKNNEVGLKNQSLVASVASYVDFYRPKYGILENVLGMARRGHGRDEDVLSQLICAIVGMGYQVDIFLSDAYSFGSPQSRSRLFLCFAAPGYAPLEHPEHSHAHPPTGHNGRGIGVLANGELFGRRIHAPTPFGYVTAREATRCLPVIGDGRTYQCISHSDHILPVRTSGRCQRQINAIPLQPRGMNLVKAWNEGHGIMTKEEKELFPTVTGSGKSVKYYQKASKAFGRIYPHKVFPVITANSTHPSDYVSGTMLHWDEHRILTIMEARRAQSFPDNEVIVGNPIGRWKILGNSVARTVSLALGLSLREAWLKDPNVKTSTRALQSENVSSVSIVETRSIRGIDSNASSSMEYSGFSDEVHEAQSQHQFQWPTLAYSARNYKEPLSTSNIISDKPMKAAGCAKRPPIQESRWLSAGKPAEPVRPLNEHHIQESRILPPKSALIPAKSLKRPRVQEIAVPPPERPLKIPRISSYVDASTQTPWDVPPQTLLPSKPSVNSRPQTSQPLILPMPKLSASQNKSKLSATSVSPTNRAPILPKAPASSQPALKHSVKVILPITPAVVIAPVAPKQSRPTIFIHDTESESESEFSDGASSSDPEISPHPSSFASPELWNRLNARRIHTVPMGKAKQRSDSIPKAQFFVSLLSDDEVKEKGKETVRTSKKDKDEREGKEKEREKEKDGKKKYVPVDNRQFVAYAKTYNAMNTSVSKNEILIRRER